MVTFKQFVAIFKGMDFTSRELGKFYHSIKKSVILRVVGKRSWPEIYKLEEKCQWPVLRTIDDPTLPIYHDADRVLLERFIRTITEEKELRQRRSSIDKVRYWTLLQAVIDERIELFIQIFGFGDKDVKYCGAVAERYMRIRDKRIQARKKMLKIGIGTGAATLAGAAALWYISSKKDRK